MDSLVETRCEYVPVRLNFNNDVSRIGETGLDRLFKTRCEYIPVRLVHPLSLRMTVLNSLSKPVAAVLSCHYSASAETEKYD